jgi:hypothetical protein
MSITVDTDTYISVTDADTYVEEYYIQTDSAYSTWNGLSDSDKEIYLRRAAAVIDREPLVGIKSVSTQEMEFPRAIRTDVRREEFPALNILYFTDWIVQTEVPDAVKYAQVEIALSLAVGISSRVKLQQEGVKSFSLGKLSESYGSGRNLSIVSHEAKEYLKPYLAGSVAI